MFGLFKKKTAPAGDQKAKKKRGQRGRRGNAKRFANGDGASVLPLKTSGKTITHMNLDVNDARVYFGALGGMEEIGCNLYLYGTGGDWIIVDLGIGFADERLPGAQRRIPDVSFLKSIKGRIRGILLTHSHYDHFAAIADVWEEIRCPVWGTPFALEMLAHMLAEKGLGRKVEMNRVDPAGESFKLGAFEVEYIHATHSIPESSFIVLRTPQGLIFHSGDFRFDPEPVIGATTDMERLAELGREGVLACMCESTNSLIHESGRTEKTAAEELFKTMSSIKSGKIVVTCFATSIARVSSVWEAAKKLGRKLAVAGRSFHINIAAAKKCGYLSDLDYIEINDAVKMADDEVIYLCTGTQGEPRSTITRLASETYANLHIGAGDTVIFSSR
ncbi:MAG: ribonuclease J, partial [Rickettsiales bacterium]|nr:ribonuclease J [Rickettsiales bacterium]